MTCLRAIRVGLLSLVLAPSLAGAGSGGPDRTVMVGLTSKFLFAFDQDGNVLWKNPFRTEEIVNYVWGSNVTVVNLGKSVLTFDLATGRLLWQAPCSARARGVVVSGDTVLVATGRELLFYRAATGRKLGSQPRARSRALFGFLDFLKGLIPRRPVRTPILVEATPTCVVAFDQNANRLWKKPLRGYRFLGTSLDLGFLACQDSVTVFDTRTGGVVWRKGYPAPIDHVVIGSRTEVILANGEVYVHESQSSELLAKKRL